ncbi:MAG TPA: ATP-binding protein [Solirubrobacteraceae bacterium]|nr:ATP-binding protein [Solirubrobacteraceae bacterium]
MSRSAYEPTAIGDRVGVLRLAAHTVGAGSAGEDDPADESPDASALSRPVFGLEPAQRTLAVEATAAALFLAGAGVLAVVGHWTRSLSLAAVLVSMAAYVISAQVRFPVGEAWTAPTELVFVPMLFLLPAPLVPLTVAVCSLSDLVLRRPGKPLSWRRAFARVADSWYSLGPAVVLTIAGVDHLSWAVWPVLVLAFGAQMVGDAASGLARAWYAERVAPRQQINMVWLYASDACLACLGVIIAIATTQPSKARLFSLCVFPLLGLLALSARDRRELRRSRRHLAEAQIVAGMGSAESDASGRHVLWSGAVATLHNLASATAPSVDAILRSLSDPDSAALTASRMACLATGKACEIEYTVLANANGPERIVRMRLSRAQPDEGTPKGMIATYQDVTDRVRRDRAEAASAAKSQLLSRMSHELRTPLNAILGFGQLLECDRLTPHQRANAGRIVDAGKHLLEMIDEVLDTSRARTVSQELVPVEVNELLAELVPMTELFAHRRGLRLEVDCGAGDAWVLATSRCRLREALTNLLMNAVKYNRDGGRVGLTVDHRSPTVVRIAISDEGPGIPEELLPRLFEPFDRLGAEASNIEGTGLGLALTKGIIEAMNGSVSVTSRPGAGATFTVELARTTVATAAKSQDESGLSVAQRSETPHHDELRHVLLIEDNAANAALVQALTQADPRFRLLWAQDGASGLELAFRRDPDLVLLDLMLEDMTGEAVLHQLRATRETADIPVVIMSADTHSGRAQQLLSMGATAFLTKPLEINEFIRTLDEIAAHPKPSAVVTPAVGARGGR